MNLVIQPDLQNKALQIPTDPYAIVLCGGGAAGADQAGVLAAYAQAGVVQKASVIVGTSVGGLTAALFALLGGNTPDNQSVSPVPADPWKTAVEVWESIKSNNDIYKGSINWLSSVWGFITGAESILDPSPLHNKIAGIFKDKTLEDVTETFNTQLIVSSLDLNSRREEFYSSFNKYKGMKIVDALKRTSAIPGVFKSIPGKDGDDKNTHWHIDGGLGANNPFIALNMYNAAFPGAVVKKVIVIYCYPEAYVDTGTELTGPDTDKSYKTFRDTLLGCIPASLDTQEQIAEMIIEDKVLTSQWDVGGVWPLKPPTDALQFGKTAQLLREGYARGVEGMIWSYREKAMVRLVDFIKRV